MTRAYEREPAERVWGEPEIVELGLNEEGNKQWFMATREGFQEVGEDGCLQLDMQHFTVGTRITLEEPLDDTSCSPPSLQSHARDDIPSDVLNAAWAALFGENIVRTPHRKLLVLGCARLVMAERAKARAKHWEPSA